MKKLKYTLITDGSSDKTLLHIIKWSLDNLFPKLPNEGFYADYRNLPNPPKRIKDKVKIAKEQYPFDILFIHRDAEKTDNKIINQRISEIKKGLDSNDIEKIVCIIPIKMMESWLLFDVEAIKKAAGNRKYRDKLALPSIEKIENEKQPKILLHKLLKQACGLNGRNLKRFNIDKAVHLVAENIQDYSPLRKLKAYNIFENNLKNKINMLF